MSGLMGFVATVVFTDRPGPGTLVPLIGAAVLAAAASRGAPAVALAGRAMVTAVAAVATDRDAKIAAWRDRRWDTESSG
ncbi:hypothetical protein GCM10009682_14820 [Luedemannella flava]|uniref:Uncharacterized protein n=1 Tax=Luedemannella flava TaxID=349316 RepID=A0ABN2LNL2_9ACTN